MDDNPNDIVYTQQNQQSTLTQGADSEDATAVLDDQLNLDDQEAPSILTSGKYFTDTDTIDVFRDDNMDVVVTQPHDPNQDMRVDIDTNPSSSLNIRSVAINTRNDPIEVRILTDPVEGTPEDLPRPIASQQDARTQRTNSREVRSQQAEPSGSNIPSSQPTPRSSQTRYELRQRLNTTPSYTVRHILRPP